MVHHQWVTLVTMTLNSNLLAWDTLVTTLSSDSSDNPQTPHFSPANQVLPLDIPLPSHLLARLTRTLTTSISIVLASPHTRLRNMLTFHANLALPTPMDMLLLNYLSYQRVLYRVHP